VARHFHIAIVGTVGSPKLKVGEDFANERERLFGSGAWGRMAATVWILTPAGKDAARVNLSMLGRHSKRQTAVLEWQQGKLVELAEQQLQREGDTTMVEWILEQQQFTRAQLRKQFGLSGSTVNRKLEGWNSQRLSSGTRRTPRGAPGTTRRDGGTTVSFWTCPKSVLSSGLSTAGFCPKRCPIGQSKTPFYKTKSFACNVMHHSPYGREEFVSFVHCGQLDSYSSV